MPKLCRYALFVVLAAAAHAGAQALEPIRDYRIKLTKNLGGLDIAVATFSGPAVTVGLKNRSGTTALCSASFVSYPHTVTMDETRRAVLAPGEQATLAYPAKNLGGNFSTAFVDVKCSEHKSSRR